MNSQENHTEGERLRRSKYGLGDRRTFQQLMEFSGIDPVHKRQIRDRCGNIEYVPFKEHPLGPDYIPRFDENFDPLDEPDEGSVYYDPNMRKSRTVEEKERIVEKRNYIMKQKNDIIGDTNKYLPSHTEPSLKLVGMDKEKKDVNENIWFDIVMELSLLFIILAGCYYCIMLPNRSTKNL